MATAKKSAAKKKAAPKIAKKAPVVAAETPRSDAVAREPVAKKKRGRPAGSTNEKSGKKSAGRPAATRFLYSLAQVQALDELGLGDEAPQKVEVIGPFGSEQSAMEDALASIGSRSDIEVTLYRDYRKGTVEVKTRLV